MAKKCSHHRVVSKIGNQTSLWWDYDVQGIRTKNRGVDEGQLLIAFIVHGCWRRFHLWALSVDTARVVYVVLEKIQKVEGKRPTFEVGLRGVCKVDSLFEVNGTFAGGNQFRRERRWSGSRLQMMPNEHGIAKLPQLR